VELNGDKVEPKEVQRTTRYSISNERRCDDEDTMVNHEKGRRGIGIIVKVDVVEGLISALFRLSGAYYYHAIGAASANLHLRAARILRIIGDLSGD